MTQTQAIEFVTTHEDDDNLQDEELRPVFAALYGREADEQDEREGLWTACVMAVEDQHAQE